VRAQTKTKSETVAHSKMSHPAQSAQSNNGIFVVFDVFVRFFLVPDAANSTAKSPSANATQVSQSSVAKSNATKSKDRIFLCFFVVPDASNSAAISPSAMSTTVAKSSPPTESEDGIFLYIQFIFNFVHLDISNRLIFGSEVELEQCAQ
jgi:hypothetical protein